MIQINYCQFRTWNCTWFDFQPKSIYKWKFKSTSKYNFSQQQKTIRANLVLIVACRSAQPKYVRCWNNLFVLFCYNSKNGTFFILNFIQTSWKLQKKCWSSWLNEYQSLCVYTVCIYFSRMVVNLSPQKSRFFFYLIDRNFH